MQSEIILLDDIEVTNLIHKEIVKSLVNDTTISDFTNPLEALEYIKESSNKTLLFLDLNMPEMSGFEVLQELKSLGKDIDTIVLTSSLNSIDKTQAQEFKNVIEFMVKPVQLSEMKRILSFYL